MQMIAGLLGIRVRFLVVAVAFLGMLAAFYFCCAVVSFVIVEDDEEGNNVIWNKISQHGIYKNAPRILVFICFAVLVICSLNANIWLDETFSLRIIQYGYKEVIQYTAADVHPPLYYILLKAVVDLFSHLSASFTFTVIISKLFSVLSYALTALICWCKLKGYRFRTILLLFLFASGSLAGYGIEIRMYGWALFFVTSAYLFARDIMDGKGKAGAWVIFVVFSLCGAYTHYFALVSIGAIWFYLFIWLLLNNRKQIKQWLIFGVITVVGYLPWLMVLLEQAKAVSESYWISDIHIGTIAGYIMFILPGALMLIFFVAIVHAFVNRKKEGISLYDWSGGLIPVTTAAVGVLASILIRPVFISRYLIPGCLCMWISFLLICRKTGRKQQVIITGIVIISCVVSCFSLTYSELRAGQQTKSSMDFIVSMDEDSVIYVEEDVSDHAFYTLATYTDKNVYYGSNDNQKEVFLEIYSNAKIASDEGLHIDDFLDNGKTVYYVTANSEADIASLCSEGNGVLLGKYLFESYVFVYEITACEYGEVV